MVHTAIAALVRYGVACNLLTQDDVIYAQNRILEVLQLDSYEEAPASETIPAIEEILATLLADAIARGVIEDNIIARDLLDAKIMGCITPLPSMVRANFWTQYEKSPKQATDWYYAFCQNCDDVRRYRIKKDLKWVTATAYGDLDITINLSKPEKDPKAIAAAKNAPQSAYPKCQLCAENEGYAGHMNHPARQNHRIIPITMHQKPWYFQFSPYSYYPEHCIAFSGAHVPMKIECATFEKMLEFVTIFPHYFIGSNADLPIVGGSILSHDHFQGGRYAFAMEKAPIEQTYCINGFEDVQVGIVRWPMSVLRLRHADKQHLIALADHVLETWRGYTDEKAVIFAQTAGEPHNTITPIARRRGEDYELDLVLRNNLTTQEHPMGVYHPHANLHHIKKENIGLIEVMGLAVLPARLRDELNALQEALKNGADLRADERTAKHADWAENCMRAHGTIAPAQIGQMIEQEVGKVFLQVLEDAGVYKRTAEGQTAFSRFLKACGGEIIIK